MTPEIRALLQEIVGEWEAHNVLDGQIAKAKALLARTEDAEKKPCPCWLCRMKQDLKASPGRRET